MSKSKKAKTLVANKLPDYSDESIVVDFGNPTCWKCVRCDYFTNYLETRDEFINKHRELFDIVVRRCRECRPNNIYQEKHCHKINNTDKQKVYKIVKEILKNNNPLQSDEILNELVNDADLWQIGFKGTNIRLIGFFKSFIFNVIFIDYHHLIYSDKNYNDRDFMKFSISAHEGDKCES